MSETGKSICLLAVLVVVFALGRWSAINDSNLVKMKKLPPDRSLHSFEVYKPGAPEIAETLLVLEDGDEPRADRPVWTVRYSTAKGVVTYRCQAATKE